MKILHISDNHGDLVAFLNACKQESDIVVHSGDLLPDFYNENYKCWDGELQGLWLRLHANEIKLALDGRPFVFVQGNHDWTDLKELDYIYLHELDNSGVTIDSIKFYGFPNTPNLHTWNHFTDDDDFIRVLANIPDDTDVLVPHCPPYGIMDELFFTGESVGIRGLKERISQTKTRMCLFGHIHEQHGLQYSNGIWYSNAAMTSHILELT